MSVSVEKLEHNLAKMTIEIPVETIEKAIDKVYKQQRNRIQVPGFRKGKAPRKMIEKMYGKGIFLEDAINECVPEEYEKACEESGLDIVSQPKIEYTQTEPDMPVIFEATVAVRPEVTLGEYKGLEVEVEEKTVTDEDVDADIRSEQEKNATTEEVTDRPVEDGDQIRLDFEGFVDGEAFEGGKGKDYALTIGSHSFIDTFEEQLIGATIGEEKEVNVTFPEDYQAKELAGKPAVFQCVVKAITKKILPELDDEFAGEVSEFETMEEYRADVRRKLEERAADQNKAAKEDALLEKAAENATMDIPDLMVESQARSMIQEFAQRLQYQGLSLEQYMKYTGQTADAMLESNKGAALKRIQGRLVLEAIAAAENLEVTDEELDAEFARMAEQYGLEAEQMKSYADEAQIEEMKSNLKTQKAMDLLYAESK